MVRKGYTSRNHCICKALTCTEFLLGTAVREYTFSLRKSGGESSEYFVTIPERGLPGIGPPAARASLVTLELSMVLAWPPTFEETYEHHVQKTPEGNEASGKATG